MFDCKKNRNMLTNWAFQTYLVHLLNPVTPHVTQSFWSSVRGLEKTKIEPKMTLSGTFGSVDQKSGGTRINP